MRAFSGISLVSYDWRFLLQSIPAYIQYVDELILGVDVDRLTWSGIHFQLPDDWRAQLAGVDPQNKIRIIEDSFFVPGLGALEADTRQRNILSTFTKPGNWIVSVDADEVILNAQALFSYLAELKDTDVCVFGSWIVFFKQLGDSYLTVAARENGALEIFPIATDLPGKFISARYTAQKRVYSPTLALHYTWARSEEELRLKLSSWGHCDDFDIQSYLNLWRAVDTNNYRYLSNFHPLVPEQWPSLLKFEAHELARLTAGDLTIARPLLSEFKKLARRLQHLVLKR